MVLRKKGVTPSKRVQGKKAFEVDNDHDSDFDGGSSEEMVVQKTPKNKTPQGRNSQSMSTKKVSFELSSKKRPGKTPQKNNSFFGKKQPIPVAKGMKGNKSVQKKKPQSKEMDDDDDDDDLELDMDNDSDDDDDLELDMDNDSDDDLELDMDNDSDDDLELDMDDDSDDDEDEEEEQIQKQKPISKQLKNVTTSMKGADKSKEPLPKAKIPKKEIKGKSNSKEPLCEEMEEDDSDFELDLDDIDDDEEDEEQEQIQKQKSNSTQQKIPIKGADESKPQTFKAKSQENEVKKRMSKGERNLVSLFIGNLPPDATPDELRALSSDITDVSIPRNFRRFAFLRFASEEKADANYKTLQGKELNGYLLNVDYEGAKSKNKNDSKIKEEQKLKSLYVENLPIDVTSDELKALSSDIEDVPIHKNSKMTHCKSGFSKFEEKADANFKTLQGLKLKDQDLEIDYVSEKSLKLAGSKESKIYYEDEKSLKLAGSKESKIDYVDEKSLKLAGSKESKIASSEAKKLYINGVPLSATLGDVATHFPKATQVLFISSTTSRKAFVTFFNEEDAAKAFSLKEIEIDGHMLELNMCASASASSSKDMRTGTSKKNAQHEDRPAKKRKF